MNWKKLQNGSDIRGVALEGIEGENVNFTPEVVETIAKAFVKWISNTTGNQHPTIAIGADCRLSGDAVRAAVIKGAVSRALICSTADSLLRLPCLSPPSAIKPKPLPQ